MITKKFFQERDLRVSEVRVLADFRGDGVAELGDGDDVVEVVDVDSGWRGEGKRV